MRIVHCKKEPFTVYIGRPSIFGNPFRVGRDGTRQEVIARFEELAWHNSKLLKAIAELKEDDVLGCWCAPNACHGEAIMRIWEVLKKNSPDSSTLK